MKLANKLSHAFKPYLFHKHLGVKPMPTGYEEWWVPVDGYKVYAHIHRPAVGAGSPPARISYPAVIIVPGGGSPGTAYDGNVEVTADDIASLGYTVLHYDPVGRGRTGGEEDFWGPRQQDELAAVMRQFASHSGMYSGPVDIFSFSIGICISAGALSRHTDLPVRSLFDWEGPSDRFIITKNNTHKPLKNFPTSKDAFWSEREPVCFIGNITCPYFRYQNEKDHMQGDLKKHAVDLVNRAVQGASPRVQLNRNEPNQVLNEEHLDQYQWLPRRSNRTISILSYFLYAQDVLSLYPAVEMLKTEERGAGQK